MPSGDGSFPGTEIDDPFQESQQMHEQLVHQPQHPLSQPEAPQQAKEQPQPVAVVDSTPPPAPKLNIPTLAKFTVESAVLGAGMIRPITFFPIVTTVRPGDSSAYSVPDVPVAPHMGGTDIGIGRNTWEPSSTAQLDRRYSELVEFRTLLAYQFPTMIIPPLPPKSKFDDFGTFITKENILLAQQHTIARFLREIAILPEVVYFSTYTPNFFQLPREAFEDWVEKMRVLLEDFRVRNAPIVAHSKRKGGILGSERVSTITGSSTKAVRSIVKMFGSWVKGGKGSQAEAPPPEPAPKKTAELPKAVPFANGSPSEYPKSSGDTANVVGYLAYWGDVSHYLTTYRDALSAAAPPYFTYMKNSMDNITALKDVADALKAYSDVLHASPAGGELSCAADQSSELCSNTALAIEKQQSRNKREVYERILFEVTYLDAAIEAVDYVQCLWIHSNEVGGGSDNAFTAYAKDVSDRLHAYYEERFLTNFRLRMVNVMGRMASYGQQYAQEMESCMVQSAFLRTTQDPKYLAYTADE